MNRFASIALLLLATPVHATTWDFTQRYSVTDVQAGAWITIEGHVNGHLPSPLPTGYYTYGWSFGADAKLYDTDGNLLKTIFGGYGFWETPIGSNGCQGCMMPPGGSVPLNAAWVDVHVRASTDLLDASAYANIWNHLFALDGRPSGLHTPLALVAQTPLPPALLLFGSVLGIGGLLGWRRTAARTDVL